LTKILECRNTHTDTDTHTHAKKKDILTPPVIKIYVQKLSQNEHVVGLMTIVIIFIILGEK